MKSIESLLIEYGESHQNHTNKVIHWICVPIILFTIIGLFMHIPFPLEIKWYLNWAAIALGAALVYYFRLSKTMFVAFFFIAIILLKLNNQLIVWSNLKEYNSLLILVLLFVMAWIGQFYGHKIEGKKPSFLKDLQFLLIGPAWLMAFIFRKFNIKY